MKPRRLFVSRLSLPFAMAIAALLSAPTLQAASGTWTGGAATANWGFLANWNGSTEASGAGFTATFGNSFTNGYTINLNANRTIGNITLNNNAANDFVINRINSAILTLDVTSGSPTINVTNAARSLTLNMPIAGTDGMTKSGPGTLVLSGTNTYSGNTSMTGGTLNITGTLNGTSLLLGTTAAKTVINVSNNMTLGSITGASITGSTAVYNQTAGTVTSTGNAALTHVANAGGYGYLNLTGGTYSQTLNRFSVTNSSGTAGGAGVVYVGGTGTLDLTGTTSMIIGYAGMPASLTVAPGGTVTRPTAGNFWLTTNAGSYGVLNVAGGDFNTSGSGIRVGNTNAGGQTGLVNLAKGTLTLGINGVNGINAANGGTLYSNYAGGTIKAADNLTAVVPITNANLTSTSTIFGPITNNNNADTAFNTQIGTTSNFDGGLTVDTNDFAVTYTSPLLGATGNGVKQPDITVTGGSGYTGAPMVQFTGGTGTPAAGYAVISGGAVTGIVITSPGDYSVDPTGVTLTGGGGTGASVALGALTANVADSGLTKINGGTLTLTNTNTYAGPTTINGGTLTLSGSGSVNNSSGITINGSGAKFLQSSSTASTPSITLTQGTLTGSGTVGAVSVADTATAIISNNDGVVGASLTTGALTFNGAATVNTFNSGPSAAIVVDALSSNAAGIVTINPSAPFWSTGSSNLISYTGGSIGGAGYAQFALGTVTGLSPRQSALLGNSGSAITLDVSSTGDPYWTGALSNAWNNSILGAPKNWTVTGGGGATDFITGDNALFDDNATGAGPISVDIDIANVSPTSTTFNNITKDYELGSTGGFGISSGILTKSGAGKVTINNANTYAGGTVVNSGTLALGNANAISTGTLTLSGGNLDSSVADLVNAGNNVQAWDSDFTFVGTQNLNLGIGAVTMSADRTVTVSANTLTVGGVIGGGAVGLNKLGAGTLNFTGTQNFTGTIAVNAGALALSPAGALTRSNTFTGTGTLNTNPGTANLTLNGDLSGFSGTMNVAAPIASPGKLNTGATSLLGAGTIVNILNGGTWFFNTATQTGITVNVSGTGNGEGLGALRTDTGTIDSTSSVVLQADSSIGGNTNTNTGTINAIISENVGPFALTKVGSNNMILGGANTYTGLTTVSTGALILQNPSALGTTAAGTTVANNARLELDNITVTGEPITIVGTGGNNFGALQGRSGTSVWTGNVTVDAENARIGAAAGASLEVSGIIDDGANDYRVLYRMADSASTVIISGNNTYTGGTYIVGAGPVIASSLNKVVGGSASSSFGAPVTEANGMIIFGTGATVGILRYVGAGETTDRTIQIGVNSTTPVVGDTGGATIEANGTTALSFSAPTFNTPTDALTGTSPTRTLTLGGTNANANTISGIIQNNQIAGNPTAAVALTKTEAGSWTLSGANSYTGDTTIDQGTLAFTTTDQALSGGLTFGSSAGSTNVGTLDLTSASASFGGLVTVRTNNGTANSIAIGTGRTLTNTGNIYVGSGAAAAVAKLAISGNGTWSINNPSGRLVVANTDPSNSGASAQLDLSGLANFNANLANVYVGRATNAAGGAANGSPVTDTLTLAANNTITAAGVFAVGGTSQAFAGVQGAFLNLGTLNTINADTVVVGASRTTAVLAYNTGLTNPSVTLRGTAGGSTATNIYLGDAQNQLSVASASNGSTGTRGTMDFSGGSVDAVINQLIVGNGATGTSGNRGAGHGTFIIDGAASNVDVQTLVVARTRNDNGAQASSASPGASIFTLKNGTLVVNTEATLAKDIDATNTASGTQNLTAQFNVQGGTAAIGSIGTPIPLILGNQVADGNAGTMIASVNLTGGTLNVFGDITEGTQGNGTITSTVTLNGGTLDMKGNRIGLSGALIDTLDIQSGTLANVSEINNGGAWTKTGTGTLVIQGVNTFTGSTVIADGTLELTDNASIKFVLGATSGANNSISGAGVATLNGDFVIDTTAADALSSGTWTIENVATLTGEYGSTFTVVGFVDAGSNKWTKDIGGGKSYSFDETTGVLTLTDASGTSYASWAATNAIGSAANLDKDGDGVNNAVEYVLGGDVNTNDISKLPQSTISGTNLVFTFQRDVDTIDGSTVVKIEVGTTLAAWPTVYTVGADTAGSTPGVVVTEDSSPGFDTITLTVPMGTDPTKFARLAVEVP